MAGSTCTVPNKLRHMEIRGAPIHNLIPLCENWISADTDIKPIPEPFFLFLLICFVNIIGVIMCKVIGGRNFSSVSVDVDIKKIQ